MVAGGETLFDYRAYRAAFDARAASLGVEPDVLGPVPPRRPARAGRRRRPRSPSRPTKEGFGLAAMEALAAGVPLVVPATCPCCARCSATPLASPSGPTASPPPWPRRSTGAPAPDGAPAAVLAAAGRSLAARHTWDAAAAAHLRLYRTLVPSPAGGSLPGDVRTPS